MKNSKILVGAFLLATLFSACSKDENKTTPVVEQSVTGEVSGTWVKGSIIQVKTDIIIPAGKSLTIEEGVTVVMDTTSKPEIIVNGNLYITGSTANPVKMTVPESARITKNKFGKLWGGILASKTCSELLLNNVIMEYGGAVTTESSTSVKQGLYKAVSGEFDPAIWFSNTAGKLVMQNSIVRFWHDDCTYLEGGSIIFSNNTFHTTGESGGEAINIKSGCVADVAYNLIYSTNTNALKLSNAGDRTPQAYVVAYNNTIVNTGWRRPTIKGGSIWLEASVRADLYNNLMANTRFGIKRDVKKPEDTRSVVSNSLYYGYTQEGVNQFQPSTEILTGKNDIISTKAGDNDPKFVNYPVSTDKSNADFTTTWDFHLATGSPALNKGITTFTRNYKDGITINGQTYKSPEPASYIGAFGTK
ncbi:right-handed parallel beta-helix repeat-containing protein [Arcicella aquatica]|uniref:Right-handed parallel beta-helix repeat-containing protein n=1 Tax=Arcicella aquatica TaxID=217141 RepID=A0ABU5QM44_9BACT|nr:right-handed parallel beta-helix repeat-containing protein [Arcicella aquatica]MEA5258135.1 right-handed parallel beta-helix repeat-containing protein [Arcicella aquatica]